MISGAPAGEMRPRGLKQVGKTKYDGNRYTRKFRCQDCGAIRRTAGEVGVLGESEEVWERPPSLH